MVTLKKVLAVGVLVDPIPDGVDELDALTVAVLEEIRQAEAPPEYAFLPACCDRRLGRTVRTADFNIPLLPLVADRSGDAVSQAAGPFATLARQLGIDTIPWVQSVLGNRRLLEQFNAVVSSDYSVFRNLRPFQRLTQWDAPFLAVMAVLTDLISGTGMYQVPGGPAASVTARQRFSRNLYWGGQLPIQDSKRAVAASIISALKASSMKFLSGSFLLFELGLVIYAWTNGVRGPVEFFRILTGFSDGAKTSFLAVQRRVVGAFLGWVAALAAFSGGAAVLQARSNHRFPGRVVTDATDYFRSFQGRFWGDLKLQFLKGILSTSRIALGSQPLQRLDFRSRVVLIQAICDAEPRMGSLNRIDVIRMLSQLLSAKDLPNLQDLGVSPGDIAQLFLLSVYATVRRRQIQERLVRLLRPAGVADIPAFPLRGWAAFSTLGDEWAGGQSRNILHAGVGLIVFGGAWAYKLVGMLNWLRTFQQLVNCPLVQLDVGIERPDQPGVVNSVSAAIGQKTLSCLAVMLSDTKTISPDVLRLLSDSAWQSGHLPALSFFNSAVNGTQLAALLRLFPPQGITVAALDLHFSDIRNGFFEFSQALPGSGGRPLGVHQLNVDFAGLTDMDIARLATQLGGTGVRYLSAAFNQITDVTPFEAALDRGMDGLVVGNGLSGSGLSRLIQRAGSLQTFGVFGPGVNSTVVDQLVAPAPAPLVSRFSGFYLGGALQNSDVWTLAPYLGNLNTLFLGASPSLTDVSALQMNGTAIQTASFTGNGIGPDRLAPFLASLRGSQVRTLILAQNPLGEAGGLLVADALADGSLNGVRVLYLGRTNLTARAALAIAQAIRHNSQLQLQILDVYGNPLLGSEAAVAVLSAVADSSTVVYVDLSGIGLGDSGAAAVNSLLPTLTRVQTLRLGDNQLSEAATSQLVRTYQRLMAEGGRMSLLDLWGNELSSPTVTALIQQQYGAINAACVEDNCRGLSALLSGHVSGPGINGTASGLPSSQRMMRSYSSPFQLDMGELAMDPRAVCVGTGGMMQPSPQSVGRMMAPEMQCVGPFSMMPALPGSSALGALPASAPTAAGSVASVLSSAVTWCRWALGL